MTSFCDGEAVGEPSGEAAAAQMTGDDEVAQSGAHIALVTSEDSTS